MLKDHEYIIKEYRDKPIKMIEIGVNIGNNAAYMLSNYNIEKYYLIDPYINKLHFRHDAITAKKKAHERLDVYKQIVWIEKLSDEAYKNIPDDIADILFIDGCHKKQVVKNDINNYQSKVKTGGIIIGDDYNENQVKRAIEELKIKYKVSKAKNDTNVFYFRKEHE